MENFDESDCVKGETDLGKLLASLAPRSMEGEFVFCTVPGARYGDYGELLPLGAFVEKEGLTLLLTKESAHKAGFGYGTVFKGIALTVRSSLDAVGLTAAVAGKLAEAGICANVVAAYHHDHVFVPVEKADAALAALEELSRDGPGRPSLGKRCSSSPGL